MKTFAGIAALAVSASALDPEFLRGAQTGMFIQSEEQFQDYDCEAPTVDPKIQQYIDMAEPMKMMMANMNKGQPNPLLDNALDAVRAFGKVSALFDEDYEGGEFCKGLLFSKEASRVIFKVGQAMINQKKDEPVSEQEKKKLKSNFLQ